MRNIHILLVLAFSFIQAETAHLEIQNVNLDEGTLDIYMENDVPVSGIQFQINGITLINLTVGEILPSGWVFDGMYIESTNTNNFLGYSIGVNLMPPNEGVLATINFTYNAGEDICIIEGQTPPEWDMGDMPLITGEIPAGETFPIVIPCTVGDCYENDDIGTGTAHLEIQNVNLDEGTLDIYMENDEPVTGIQFQITGITLMNVTVGEIVPSGWVFDGMYIEGNDFNNFLGYSIGLNLMPPNEGVLATISFTYNTGEDICIIEGQTPPEWSMGDMPLITGEIPAGEVFPVVIPCTVGDCYENDDNWIYGCTYETATNYNPDATFDDGSCEFMWGDVNHDGALTIQDLILIVNEILSF